MLTNCLCFVPGLLGKTDLQQKLLQGGTQEWPLLCSIWSTTWLYLTNRSSFYHQYYKTSSVFFA
jgi:hypothetical protein